MRPSPSDHRPRPAAGRDTSAILLAFLVTIAAPSTACATATTGGAQDEETGSGETVSGANAGQPGSATEADMERTIAGRRFVREGEDWYLESDGRRFRVLPHSLSLQFRDGATDEEQRDFLASRGFEIVRRNRLGILDVRTGADRHAVDWLAELTGNKLLALVDVNTEGAYEAEGRQRPGVGEVGRVVVGDPDAGSPASRSRAASRPS